jgi:hypothetical protein
MVSWLDINRKLDLRHWCAETSRELYILPLTKRTWHELAAYIFIIHRVTSHSKQREIIIVIQTEWKNGFPIDIRYCLNITIKHEPTQPNTNYAHSPNPCVSFTCHSPLVRKATNLFKNTSTNFKIIFPTINTIYNILRAQLRKKTNTFRMAFTISNVLPSVKHMMDKLEEIWV